MTAAPQSLEKLLTKHKAANKIKAYTVRLTVSLAQHVVKTYNTRNRPVTNGLVKAYANEFLRGEWRENGEPFIFGVDPATGQEDLISGQHRALALIRAQACIDKGEEWPNAQLEYDCVFITGVDTQTADTVDTGKSRTHTDVLFRDPWVDTVIGNYNASVSGRKTWVKTLAGAARLVWIMQGGATVSHAPKFNTTEMLAFVKNQHPGLTDFIGMVLDADAADGGNGGLKMSLPYIAAICYAASLEFNKKGEAKYNKDVKGLLEDFLKAVAGGSNLAKGTAAWALTAYWNKLTAEPGSKDRDRDWAGPFIKAINHYIQGDTNLKISDISLSKKERDNYAAFPPFCSEWHQHCFEHAAAIKAAASEAGSTPASKPDNDGTPEAEESTGDDAVSDGADSFVPETSERKTRKPKSKLDRSNSGSEESNASSKSSSVKASKPKRAAKIDAAELVSEEDEDWQE